MEDDINLSSFYFVSGHERVHTGYEVCLMIEQGHIEPNAYCCITGALDLLFWFKDAPFFKENDFYLKHDAQTYLLPVTSIDIVSNILTKKLKVCLVINGERLYVS